MVKDAFIDIFSRTWPSIVIFLVIVILLRFFYIKQSRQKFVLHEEIFLLLFLTYILLLFELVTSRDVEFAGINYIPFREILRYDVGSTNFYRQVLGNIILFIPFGYFASRYVDFSKFRQVFWVCFLTSGTIEAVQLFIGRSFDVDDILLNVIGGIIGFLIYVGFSAIEKRLPKFLKKDIVYDIFTLLILTFVVLYFIGILKV